MKPSVDAKGELRATLESVALADRGAHARLIGTGPDLIGLLQRLGTGDLRGLAPGRGSATVLTSNKGRIVQRLLVTHLGEPGILLSGGPAAAPAIFAHLRRYTFAEKTGLEDRTGDTCQFALVGPAAARTLASTGIDVPEPLGARRGRLGEIAVDVVGHDGLSAQGFSVVAHAGGTETLRESLAAAVQAAGGAIAGPETLEAWRILRGLGVHGHELTEDHNPLEAGLRDAVSFTKGCYVGQEVVARLENYDKVVRALAGVEFDAGAGVTPGDSLFVPGTDAREIGRVSSAVVPVALGRGIGLAYVRHRELTLPRAVRLRDPSSGPEARLVPLPFPEATIRPRY